MGGGAALSRPRRDRGRLRVALALAFVFTRSPAAGAQTPPPTPVFPAGVEAVYVDAFVTHGGKPVRDLTASDFELRDEGVVRPVELVASESMPVMALLVFDTSGSVAGEKLAALRSAAQSFLEIFRPADEIGLLTFSDEIAWGARPGRDREKVRAVLEGLRARGATSALDALYAALVLPSAPGRSLIVLFSDGEDNLSWLGERQVRTVVQRSNALIQVVGMRPPPPPGPPPRRPPDEPESIRVFRQLAELTGGSFWAADSPGQIRSAFESLATALEARCILRFEPPPDRREGWHRLELRLRNRPGRVQARRGYWIDSRP